MLMFADKRSRAEPRLRCVTPCQDPFQPSQAHLSSFSQHFPLTPLNARPEDISLSHLGLNSTSSHVHHFLSKNPRHPSLCSDEPFYCVNLSAVIHQINEWHRQLPRVDPFYALKANPDSRLLEILTQNGCGFDCASKREIAMVLELLESDDGTTTETPVRVRVGDRIIFAHPIKKMADILFALKAGVQYFVVDSLEEIHKFVTIAKSGVCESANAGGGGGGGVPIPKNLKVGIVIRLVTNDRHSLCQFSSKFGATITEALSILRYVAKIRSSNASPAVDIKVEGVSFHVGSGCMFAGSFREAIQDAKRVFCFARDIDAESGSDSGPGSLSLLDLGGGFPGVLSSQSALFRAMTSEINECLDEFFPKDEFPDLRVIAEPGRYFAAPGWSLVMPVIGKKKKVVGPSSPPVLASSVSVSASSSSSSVVDESNSESIVDSQEEKKKVSFHYYLPDGLYGSLNCIYFDHYVPNFCLVDDDIDVDVQASSTPPSQEYPSTFWGPTCDGMDLISRDVPMPELDVGNWLFLKDVGAYSVAAACPFNGFAVETILYFWSSDLVV